MKMWKQKWKAAVSLALALILILSSLPFYSSYAVENNSNAIILTKLQMLLNGKEVSENSGEPTLFKKKDAFTIDLEWELPDSMPEDEDYDYTLDLSGRLKGLKLSDVGQIDLEQNGEVIGSVHVGESNTVSVKINKESIGNLKNRTGWAQIVGVLSDAVTDEDHGKKLDIGVGNKTYWLQYDADIPESFLRINEYLPDHKGVRRQNGTYIQTFGVTLTAKNGEVILTDLEKSLGEYLGNISNVRITESGIDGVVTGTYGTWDALVAALNNKILKKNQKVTFTYDVEVSAENILDFDKNKADILEKYHNTVTAVYNTNKGNSNKQSASATASVVLPTVSSSGTVSGDKQAVDWTITLKLNSLWESGQSLAELGVESLKDSLGDGFEKDSVSGIDPDDIDLDNIDLTSLRDEGNGVFIGTFQAPIKEDYQNRPGNTVLTNTVTVTINDHPIEGRNAVTIQGDQEETWLSKQALDYDEETGLLSWQVDLDVTDISTQISEVSLIEKPGKHHDLYNITIDVDGDPTEVLKEGVVQSGLSDICTYDEESGTIRFEEGFITGKASSETITVSVDTKPRHGYVIGKTYHNKAILTYTYQGKKSHLTAEADWEPDKDSKLTKTGRHDCKDPGNVLSYEIQVDLENLNLEKEKKIVLKDKLPEGMDLISDSLTVVYPKETPYHITPASVTPGEGEFTVEISVTEEMTEDQEKGELKKLQVNYKTRRTKLSDNWKNGEKEKLTNVVSGTYDTDTDLGRASAYLVMNPPQLVSKSVNISRKAPIYSNTRPGYTLNINPGAMDLVEENGENKDRIQAVDTLGTNSALQYDQSSIHVWRQSGDAWMEMNQGDDGYTYRYDPEKNALIFDLPDATAIRITYNTFIKPGVTMLKEDNSSNRVALNLEDYSGSQSVITTFTNRAVKAVGASAGENYATITINKYWEQDGVSNYLSGSEFEIYRMNSDKTMSFWKECKAVSNADEEKQYVVSRLQYDRVYVLRETKADAGFKINAEDYYFYIFGEGIEGIEELERNGYEVVREGEEPSGNNTPIHQLTNGGTLNFENKRNDNTGIIRLRKIVKGPVTQESDLKDITFEITDGSGKKQIIKLSQMRRVSGNTDADLVYEKQIVCTAGKYSVEEIHALVDGFVADTTYEVNGTDEGTGADGGNVTVNAGETQEVTFINTYQEDPTQGKLVITKTLDGPVSQNQKEAEETLEFRVYENDNTNKAPIETYTLEDFTRVGNVYTKELPLSAGNYTVREVNYDALTGCVFQSVKYQIGEAGQYQSGDTAKVTVNADRTTKVHFVDTYTASTSRAGTLRITKTIQGPVTKKEAESALRFRVTDRKAEKEVAVYTLPKDFTLQTQGDGRLVYVLNLPYQEGEYQVEESTAFISGYEETVSHAVGDNGLTVGNKAPIEITDGTVTEVAFQDVYTEIANPGELVITKTIHGSVTREEAEDALRFLVTRNSDGKEREFTLREFDYNADKDLYTLKLETAAGGYTVEETVTGIDGYVTQGVQYFLNGTAITGDSVTADVTAGGTTTVAVTDTYMAEQSDTGVLILTKQIDGGVTRQEAEGALCFTVTDTGIDGPGTTYTLKDFSYKEAVGLYTMTLTEPVGTYQVVETATDIQGYVLKSVTYSVNSGKVTEGTGTQVTINKDSAIQFHFKDVYERQGNTTMAPEITTASTPTPTAIQTPKPTGKVGNENDDMDDDSDDDGNDDDTKGGKKRTHQGGSTPKTADERYSLLIAEFVVVLISGFGIILLALREKRYAYIKRHTKKAVNSRKEESKK